MIQLNPARNPREVDFIAAAVEAGKPQIMNGLGIYQWKPDDPDTVVVCFHPDGKTRPTDFSSKPGSGRVMITMKRIWEGAAKSDHVLLQGKWNMVSGIMNGLPIPEAEKAASSVELDATTFIFHTSRQDYRGKYEIDTKKTPKTIDLFTAEAANTGIVPGPGIYALDGDELRFCFAERGKPRPSEFTSPAGSNQLVLILKRKEARSRGAEELVVTPLPPDLNLVPRDAVGFVSIRVADLLKEDGAKRLQQGLARQSPLLAPFLNNWEANVTEVLTIRPSEIERATAVLLHEGGEAIMILATIKPYDRRRIIERQADVNVEKLRGSDRYYMISGKNWRHSVYFVSETILVLGMSGWESRTSDGKIVERGTAIEPFVWELPAQRPQGPLSDGLQLAARKHHIVIGLNPPASAISQLATQLPPNVGPLLASLGRAKTVTLTADLHSLSLRKTGADLIQIVARLLFENTEDATQAEQAAQQLRRYLQESVGKWVKGWAPVLRAEKEPGWADAIRTLNRFLDEVELALRTSRLELRTLPGETTPRVLQFDANIRTDLDAMGALQQPTDRPPSPPAKRPPMKPGDL
jgi:uncharacterized protein (TIGR03067 family)